MSSIGDRVGAILGSEDGVISFLGFGVYEGDFIPEDAAGGWIGKMMRELAQKNPRLKLDNGDVVWGCECWWGSEDEVRRQLEGRKVLTVSIATARHQAQH